MKKKVIFFGVGKISEVISYYAENDCEVDIVAYTVDEEYNENNSFLGRPVINFKDIQEEYTPTKYELFVAVGYHNLNKVRQQKIKEAKEKGFKITSIVSPKAYLPTNVTFGENCFIMPPCEIHPCVDIGDNVFVWSGAIIGHHTIIKNDCWITSGANISGKVIINENTFIAINATIGHGVNVGNNCFIGANTLVTKDLNDKSVLIQESSKPIRLNSNQFLKMSKFSSL